VPTAKEEAELRDALLALRPHDPDVTLEVVQGISRPPYAKTPAIQAPYDHAAVPRTRLLVRLFETLGAAGAPPG
jgi:hypothetical protein